jgi:opacity protein-like surface antigen
MFDPLSLFTFDHNGSEGFSTKTEMAALSGKFMFLLPKSTVRAFSSVGAAGVHRDDVIANRWRLSPTFGVGLNYNLSPNVMVEAGINYTGGYGESELDPAEDYIPFLYSGFLRLAYRF